MPGSNRPYTQETQSFFTLVDGTREAMKKENDISFLILKTAADDVSYISKLASQKLSELTEAVSVSRNSSRSFARTGIHRSTAAGHRGRLLTLPVGSAFNHDRYFLDAAKKVMDQMAPIQKKARGRT